jgi:hypothetical protein
MFRINLVLSFFINLSFNQPQSAQQSGTKTIPMIATISVTLCRPT